MPDGDFSFMECEDGECDKPHHHMHKRGGEEEPESELWEEGDEK
jgi:hypothetical protein